MRIDTKEKRASYRAILTPKNATRDERSGDHGEAFKIDGNGKFCAMAFRGTAGKYEFYYSYRTAEQRDKKIDEFFASIASHAEYIAKQRKAATDYRHDVKVGDIFRCSWGYDQTNIDYYEVTALVGKCFAEVREIAQQSKEDGFMSGDCVPVPGSYLTKSDGSEFGQAYKAQHGHYPQMEIPPRRVRIQGYGTSEPSFRVASYASAYRVKPLLNVAGIKSYAPSRWTSYA